MINITAAMNDCKPEIAERYIAQVRRLHTGMVADLGQGLRGVGNSWTWTQIYNGTVRRYLTADRRIDDARLTIGANAYADNVVAAWQDDINAKLGELENADVQRLDGVSFRISGKRGRRHIVIDQKAIINVSKLGTPFHQFPAVLYVDGKRTSEAAYKRAGL